MWLIVSPRRVLSLLALSIVTLDLDHPRPVVKLSHPIGPVARELPAVSSDALPPRLSLSQCIPVSSISVIVRITADHRRSSAISARTAQYRIDILNRPGWSAGVDLSQTQLPTHMKLRARTLTRHCPLLLDCARTSSREC